MRRRTKLQIVSLSTLESKSF